MEDGKLSVTMSPQITFFITIIMLIGGLAFNAIIFIRIVRVVTSHEERAIRYEEMYPGARKERGRADGETATAVVASAKSSKSGSKRSARTPSKKAKGNSSKKGGQTPTSSKKDTPASSKKASSKAKSKKDK